MPDEPILPVPARAAGADVRRNNLEVVLRHLAYVGPDSRAAIAARTGLTRATVSRLVGDLISMGLVREGARLDAGRAGRPSTSLELAGQHVLAVGAEVNVDYLAVLVLDLAGREVLREERPFDSVAAGPAAAITGLTELCRATLRAIARRPLARPLAVSGLAVAVPGLVDLETGVVAEAPNLHWRDVAVAEPLRRRLRLEAPVHVGNDANYAALAEYRVGGCAGTANLVYITGEVGIGGGIVSAGQLLLGRRGFGGEIGHMRVDPDGPLCGCGRRGCWEAVIGLSALLRSSGLDDPDGGSPRIRFDRLLRGARSGDPRILAVLERLGTDIGHGSANLANVLDPDVIILGGYFVDVEQWILPSAQRALEAGLLGAQRSRPRVVASALGYTAPALGGALHAMDRVISDPTTLLPVTLPGDGARSRPG